MSWNWNHLALFHAVAMEGSVSRAATRLRISQPAVSKQVRELERALGTELLERLPRGVRLTAAGDLLVSYTRRLFPLAAEAEAAMRELQGLQRGALRIGASMTIGVYLLPQLLAEMKRRWPRLELTTRIDNTASIQKALVEHELDLGMTEGPGGWEDDLDSRRFRRDELTAIVSSTHPLAQRDGAAVSVQRFLRFPWIAREPGSGTRATIDVALAELGVQAAPTWVFNNPEAIKRAVLAGCGVAIVPALTVELEVKEGQLHRLRLRGWKAERELRLQWLRAKPWSAAMQAFDKLLNAQ